MNSGHGTVGIAKIGLQWLWDKLGMPASRWKLQAHPQHKDSSSPGGNALLHLLIQPTSDSFQATGKRVPDDLLKESPKAALSYLKLSGHRSVKVSTG